MTPKRRKRLLLIVLAIAGVATAAGFTLKAFNENLMFFYTPTAIKAGEAPMGRSIRVGGLVTKGSVKRQADGLTVEFEVTDMVETVIVQYTGILPDLFREGQGIVALGKLQQSGRFIASEVLAKHDEKYMPPEVADALKAAHKAGSSQAARAGGTP